MTTRAALILLAVVALAPCAAYAEQQAPDLAASYIVTTGTAVGIGTAKPASLLDASRGEVRTGDSGDACTATNEGAIRYSKADHGLQFCDGKGWRLLVSVEGQ